MTIDLRARRAGSDLRAWDPDIPDERASELIGRARADLEHRVPPPEAGRERISSERRTVAGQPALREEYLDNGDREIRWNVLLGNTMVLATAGEQSGTGTPYEDQVAATDAIVTSLRVDR